MFYDVQEGEGYDLTDDQMLVRLDRYLKTDEGSEMLDRLEETISGIQKRNQTPILPMLTKREWKALNFINREVKNGHWSTVRKIAKAVGLRSSRSGSIIIQRLIRKGVL